MMSRRVGLFATLHGYRMGALPADLAAGLMLAAIAIPEQLATARLAGFPPQAGLLAFVAASLIYAVVGGNRYMSVGADSTIAPIFAGSLVTIVGAGSAQYAPLAGFLAIAVGLILIATAVARASWIANLISIPVTVGLLAGIAVHIVVDQLPALLGVPQSPGSLLERLSNACAHIGTANVADVAIGSSVFVLSLLSSRISRRIPGALAGIVAAAIVTHRWSLEQHGVAVLGILAAPLPAAHLPTLPSFDEFVGVIPLAIVVAAVCVIQTATVGRSFPSNAHEPNENGRDFFAVGLANVLAGAVGTFPVDSSPPRTAVVKEAGGTSQVAGLVAVAVTATLAFGAASLLRDVPHAALAGVLIFIAMRILRIADMVRIATYSRREFELLIAGALCVILLPIQTGMLLAIVLSLAHGIQMMMWPAGTILVQVPGTTIWWPIGVQPAGKQIPGVVVYAPSAPINFTNAQYIHDRLLALVASAATPAHLLVLEGSGVTDIDYTGSQLLQRAIGELRSGGVDVVLARLIATHAQSAAARSGLVAALGADHIFMSVDEALRSRDTPDGSLLPPAR